ncbi:Mf(Alpha)2p NDAI_0I01240 [Naumovozyma dairenensis CBS 421]|uniref:Mating factor alpha precursor N-terminal domain-containing protein n=1 Tax=Naumovozyma dairenensis (strain ATCC 10597 / BCRC 20456 / CBS 421 / NBRC 0211 / NRRL Y-12639) TaxID=1071378 RepID=G0WFY2_NAUDC|nr:hypothetical protein NDAI_0I01240 [Naumovozyma dairenensis CBS 421]CCD26693.1 hypothetical protein NDAI_0I01240 [Naumovozyma dairenensis CBS 421]
MKFSTLLSTAAALASTSLAAPINTTETIDNSSAATSADIPAEAILGYLDLDGDNDIALLPFANATSNGLLFVNTTIVEQATKEQQNGDGSVDLTKREADAEANWHWLRLDPGQPLYKREADAEAEANWHWLRLDPGQPLYKREADADAEANWHWLRLDPGQPLYKREAAADAEANWHWLRLDPGQPLY